MNKSAEKNDYKASLKIIIHIQQKAYKENSFLYLSGKGIAPGVFLLSTWCYTPPYTPPFLQRR